MPGGKGNIKPSDNPKPFTKDNYYDSTKWNEETIHNILDDLEAWLWEEEAILDKEGTVVGMKDKGNCFYKDFLYRRGLYDNWISNYRNKYTTVSDRLSNIDKIQEHKLQLLAATGKQKEGITKFILQNKYDWKEKSQNENVNKNIEWNETKTYKKD